MTVPAVAEVEKYGVTVKVDPEMEALRGTRCLCLRCALLIRCEAAHDFLHLCQRHHVAFMMTRCPHFEQDSREARKRLARPSGGFRGPPKTSGGSRESLCEPVAGTPGGLGDGGHSTPDSTVK